MLSSPSCRVTLCLLLFIAFGIISLETGCSGSASVTAGLRSQTGPFNATALTATPVPKHVLTMAGLLGWEGSTVPASLAAPYLSWAFNPSPANVAPIQAAGIKTNVYTNGVIEYPCSGCSDLWEPLQAHPQYIAKDCSGDILYRGTGEYVNATMAGWYPFWSNNVEQQYAKVAPAAWSAVYADDSNAPQFLGISPCDTTESAFTKGVYDLLASTTHPVIFNGLSVSAKQPDERTLYGVPNVIGGQREDCFSGNNDFGHSGDFVFTMRDHFYGATTDEWTQTENDDFYAGSIHKLFICLSNAQGPARSSTAIRTYVYASFMLSYNLTTSVLSERFAPSTSGELPVYPETGLVPTNPVVASPTSVTSLLTGGVYAREYRDCYYRGTDEGACAAVVNPTLVSHGFPFSNYKRTVTLSGGGVLEGGELSFRGGAPPSTLSSGEAVIALP
jgi:hypothetical protein